MKKPVQKSKSKSNRKVQRARHPKKPKGPNAIAAPEKYYKVQLEVSSKNLATGLTEYTYTDQSKHPVSDTVAQQQMDEMKSIGVGGRIVLLDGTPDGAVQVTWGSVDRTASAEKVERATLENK